MHSWWSTKSNSMSNTPERHGIADVVSPVGDVQRHLPPVVTSGARTRRILPTICIHMCRVSRVAVQSSTRRLGHALADRVVCSVTAPPLRTAPTWPVAAGRIPHRRRGNGDPTEHRSKTYANVTNPRRLSP
jgi:hypothetical protein